MFDDVATATHPLVGAAHDVHATLDRVVDTPTWSLGQADLADAVTALATAQARLAELQARLAHRAATTAAGGATSAAATASWLSEQTRTTRPEAHRTIRLGADLDDALHEPTRHALATGRVLADQARAVVDAVDALPAEEVPLPVRAAARDALLDLAAEHDALALRRLGQRILEAVAPDLAEAVEAAALERAEERARQRTRLTLSDDGHGLVHGRFTMPAADGANLKKMLLALCSPAHHAAGQSADRGGQAAADDRTGDAPDDAPDGARDARVGPAERKPMPQRLGEALVELVRRYPITGLAQAGGLPATALVTMDLATLLGGSAPATLDTGHRISAARARMIACEAGLVPAVLGGPSEVLDLGRARRYFTAAQRKALTVEQGGCTARGCDWPPGMCHAHHDTPWSRGGRTDQRQGRLLCPHHHQRIHDPRYETTHHPDRTVSFHRRT